jgi:hypothetical protein
MQDVRQEIAPLQQVAQTFEQREQSAALHHHVARRDR